MPVVQFLESVPSEGDCNTANCAAFTPYLLEEASHRLTVDASWLASLHPDHGAAVRRLMDLLAERSALTVVVGDVARPHSLALAQCRALYYLALTFTEFQEWAALCPEAVMLPLSARVVTVLAEYGRLHALVGHLDVEAFLEDLHDADPELLHRIQGVLDRESFVAHGAFVKTRVRSAKNDFVLAPLRSAREVVCYLVHSRAIAQDMGQCQEASRRAALWGRAPWRLPIIWCSSRGMTASPRIMSIVWW